MYFPLDSSEAACHPAFYLYIAYVCRLYQSYISYGLVSKIQ